MTLISPGRVRHILIRLYDSRCQYCLTECSGLEVEHIVPRSKGGADALENYTIACRSCNHRKRALELPDPGRSLLLALAAAKVEKVTAMLAPKPQTPRTPKPTEDPIYGPPLHAELREDNASWLFPVPVPGEAIELYSLFVNHRKTFFWQDERRINGSEPIIEFSVDGYFGFSVERINAAMDWWSGVYWGLWSADDCVTLRGCFSGSFSADRDTGEVYCSLTGRLVSRSFLEYVSSLARIEVPLLAPSFVRPKSERPEPSRNILNELMDAWEREWEAWCDGQNFATSPQRDMAKLTPEERSAIARKAGLAGGRGRKKK